MKLSVESYVVQAASWPADGRHILAQFDEQSVVVHQAYRHSIAKFVVTHGYFGGEFSFRRMSWVKTNFLWMMYRSGWGTKGGQEVTLAVRIRRSFFESLLEQAVPSTFDVDLYSDTETWKRALASSCVRLQWDPDHDPSGVPSKRRAIQLGLRGDMLREYAHAAILEVLDVSEFVSSQRAFASPKDYARLLTPAGTVYRPSKLDVVKRLKLCIAYPTQLENEPIL